MSPRDHCAAMDGYTFDDTIVKEWRPNPIGYAKFRILNDEQKEQFLKRVADENGIERPKGYNVSFHYNPDVEGHHFGVRHPMKPWRLQLTKELVICYGLDQACDLYKPDPAERSDLGAYHDPEYLDFLSEISPDNENESRFAEKLVRFNFRDDQNSGDCPVFDGLWNYVRLYSGCTINAARTLISNQSDIAISWSGGLHHAAKNKASGFCYVNDIVLAILQFLRFYPRVLYIDIDVHHGDGVEAAFKHKSRVLTLSFHRYGPYKINNTDEVMFFPGTGGKEDIGGERKGKHFSINVPLKDGIDDDQYTALFETCVDRVLAAFKPKAIVLQCGADSLGGDKLGKFNLNIKAHGRCVQYVKRRCLPDIKLLLVGGGGYTPRNVARTWCHETSIAVGAPELPEEVPDFLPHRKAFEGANNGDGLLYPNLSKIKRHTNEHTAEYLHSLVEHVDRCCKYVAAHPITHMDEYPEGIDVDEFFADFIDQKRDERAAQRAEREREGERKAKERNSGGRSEHRFY